MQRRHRLPYDPKAGSDADLLEGKLAPGAAQGPTRSKMASAIMRILVGSRAAREAQQQKTAAEEKARPVEWAMRLMS